MRQQLACLAPATSTPAVPVSCQESCSFALVPESSLSLGPTLGSVLLSSSPIASVAYRLPSWAIRLGWLMAAGASVTTSSSFSSSACGKVSCRGKTDRQAGQEAASFNKQPACGSFLAWQRVAQRAKFQGPGGRQGNRKLSFHRGTVGRSARDRQS